MNVMKPFIKPETVTTKKYTFQKINIQFVLELQSELMPVINSLLP